MGSDQSPNFEMEGLYELSRRELHLPTPPYSFGSSIPIVKQTSAIYSDDQNITLQAFVAANGGDFNQLRDILVQNRVGSVFDEDELFGGRKFYIPTNDRFSIHPDG